MVGRQLPFFSVIVPFWLIWAMAGWRRMLEVWPACLVSGLSFALVQFAVSNYHGPWVVDIAGAVASIASLSCCCVLAAADGVAVRHETDDEARCGRRGTEPGPALRSAGVNPRARHAEGSPAVLTTARARPPPSLSHPATRGAPGCRGSSCRSSCSSGVCRRCKRQLDRRLVVDVRSRCCTMRSRACRRWSTSRPPRRPSSSSIGSRPPGRGCCCRGIVSGLLLGLSPATLRDHLRRHRLAGAVVAADDRGDARARLHHALRRASTRRWAWRSPAPARSSRSSRRCSAGSASRSPAATPSSNVLFGNLQQITAEQLGMSPMLAAAANSSGGVMGKMIDAQSIVVAGCRHRPGGRRGPNPPLRLLPQPRPGRAVGCWCCSRRTCCRA